MENYSYSSYPESGESSPRSREIDVENASWDEPPNYRVKFMCSYGGKISPRPHDNQLSYVGGDTKILTVDRNVRFPSLLSKLSSLFDSSPDASSFSFKYQLPGEDLDALISVTNDEDLDHMMLEYDRLLRSSPKPARLRLFLFPLGPSPAPPPPPKPDRQWFVDALNSAPIDASSPPSSASNNPDFLFGLEKSSTAPEKSLPPPPHHPAPDIAVPSPDFSTPAPPPLRSDSSKEDRYQIPDSVEIHRQIQELQRLQIAAASQEQQHQQQQPPPPPQPARVFAPEYYAQKPPEKLTPASAPPPSSMPLHVQMQTTYWPERQIPAPAPTGVTIPPPPVTGSDQPVYLVPSSVYRPSPAGPPQGYYVQRMVPPPEVYRDPPPPSMYAVGGAPGQKLPAGYGDAMVRPPVPEAAGGAYAGMGYDSAGRQVFYTAPGGVMPTYQTVTASSADVRQVPATKAPGSS